MTDAQLQALVDSRQHEAQAAPERTRAPDAPDMG
jgi:hypothetical protein